MLLQTFIFECNKETFGECIELGLFGSNRTWPLQVRKGDLCFLYNYSTHEVYAVWEAESDGSKDIIKRAWNGRYPYQVKVFLRSKEMTLVPRGAVNQIICNADGRVENKLIGYNAQNLIQFYATREHLDFEKEVNLGELDRNYRSRHDAKFICEDGHRVRSQGEMIIDNWFFHHKVVHAVEPIIQNLHNIIPDFMVYNSDGKPVYIEYWGMTGDATYDERVRIKHEIYKKNNLPFIGIKPDDLHNIDEAIRADFFKFKIPIPRQ